MIAVIASLVVLFYLLVPGGLFRLVTVSRLSLKRFHTIKAQEITFALLTSLLPFSFAIMLVWSVCTQPFPTRESYAKRRQSYRTFFQAMTSEKRLEESLKIKPGNFTSEDPYELAPFWSATDSVLKRQGRFLVWYYFLVIVEASFVVWLEQQYYKSGNKKKLWRDRIAEWLLPLILSEWHVLFRKFHAQDRIELDILTSDGILYKGQLFAHFLTQDGDLSGIILNDVLRFDRDLYRDHKKADLDNAVKQPQVTARFTKEPAEYWRPIKRAIAFYIPKEKISNINVRLEPPDVPSATESRLTARNMPDYAISTPPPATSPTVSGPASTNTTNGGAD